VLPRRAMVALDVTGDVGRIAWSRDVNITGDVESH
jgi:hypothetical protein